MPAANARFFAVCTLSLALLGQAVLAKDVTADLPREIRGLLQKEMLQVEAAMKTIHGAIIRGDHRIVEEQGQAIHDSFILKQSMTPEQRKSLKAAVPREFLMLDQEFHEMAARLSDSGARKDSADQVTLFGQMTQACLTCHSRHVSERFDGLDGQ